MSDKYPSSDEIDMTVKLLSATAHPTRLAVLIVLGRGGPMSVSELVKLVGVEQSAMSHQLRTLKEARLVEVEPDGKRRLYRLHDHHVAHIVEDALVHATEHESAGMREG